MISEKIFIKTKFMTTDVHQVMARAQNDTLGLIRYIVRTMHAHSVEETSQLIMVIKRIQYCSL